MLYTVRSGNTLSQLAQRFDTSTQALARTNGIQNPNFIQTGQTLKVPGATDGFDTGSARGAQFAQRFGPSASATPVPGVNASDSTTSTHAPATDGVSGATPSTSGQQAVDKAMSYLGTPYNHPWDRSYTGGGTDPNGLGLRGPDGSIDCSQLTSLAYGGRLPADSVTQGQMGPRLDVSQAQAGDVVCFDEHGNGTASHVGIADGKGNVIHASAYTGEVTVTPIADIASASTWVVRP